ncbi:MAG TPA: DUF6263 family protein [Hanamia sp.]
MKKITLLFSAAIGFSVMTMAQSNGSLKLAKGQKYVVENKLTTTSNTQIQGQSMQSNADISTVYNIEVKDKTDNNINLSNTISNIKLNMTMMGQNINFDSDKKDDMNGNIGSTLKDYINQPKDVIVDHSGRVIASKTDTSSAAAIASQLNFDASGYGAELAFLALPKNAKVGDTWSDDFSGDTSIKKTTTYTIKDITANVATVSFTGTIASQKSIEQMGAQINTKTTGKISGEEKVDTKTGVVQSNTSTTDASGTVTAMGQDFPTSTKLISATTVRTL